MNPKPHMSYRHLQFLKEGSFTATQTKDEVRDDELRGMIEEFIRKNMEGQGASIYSKGIQKK